MSIIDEIHIERASHVDAEEILEVQRAAFLGQARIYDNFQLPPLVQTLESIKGEFSSQTFLKAIHHNGIGPLITEGPSHTTWHTDRVPRRFG